MLIGFYDEGGYCNNKSSCNPFNFNPTWGTRRFRNLQDRWGSGGVLSFLSLFLSLLSPISFIHSGVESDPPCCSLYEGVRMFYIMSLNSLFHIDGRVFSFARVWSMWGDGGVIA